MKKNCHRADLTHPPQTRRTLRREAEGPLDFSLQNTPEGKWGRQTEPERAGVLGKATVNKGDGKE